MRLWIWRNLTITQDPDVWGRTNFGPAHRVRPFKEGIGTVSDVVKVEYETPGNPGHSSGDRVWRVVGEFSVVGAPPWVRSWWNPGTVTIPQYRWNKTKQHIHTHLRNILEEVTISQTVKLIQVCRVIRKQYLQKRNTFLSTYVGTSDIFFWMDT